MSPLVGDGVTLRRWAPGDASELARAWADPLVQAGCAVPVDRSSHDARRWISGQQHRADQAQSVDLVVEVRGRVAGEVGLGPFDHQRRAAVLGFWVGPDFRERGVASHGVGLFTNWAFEELGLAAILAQTTAMNRGSTAVLAKCGFAQLATQVGATQTWVVRSDAPGPLDPESPKN